MTAAVALTASPQPRRDWDRDAACGDADPALFDGRVTHAGATYCAGCTVRAECVAWAIDNRAEGAWGGLSTEQRTNLAGNGWRFGDALDPVQIPRRRATDPADGDAPVVSLPQRPPPSAAPAPSNGRTARRGTHPAEPANPAAATTSRPSRRRRPVQPRPHQHRALGAVTSLLEPPPPSQPPADGVWGQTLDALQDGLVVQRRGQLIMACGTGKTLIGRWAAERLDARRTLVLLPSLQLVAQTLREWRRAGDWPCDTLVVCSDPTTAAGARERGEDGDDPFAGAASAAGLGRQVPVTTDPAVAARFLHAAHGRRLVVFSTYHSAPVVRDAIRTGAAAGFDFMVCDEAHRLANSPSASFRLVVDDTAIPAERRLFLTATPVLLGGRLTDGAADSQRRPLSMDDETVFGPVLHRLSYAQAIAEELLCDYRVLVVAEHAGPGDPGGAGVALAALRDAADRFGLRRILTFHSRVAAAERFAGLVNTQQAWNGRAVWAEAVRSGMPAQQRQAALDRLEDVDDGQVGVVASARCLSEGIDVPAVDGILFVDPRRSVTSIVQAVGRVLRRAPGKQTGTIVIPVVLPASDRLDDEDALLLSAFAPVWAVLRALRAHDERLAEQLDELTRRSARRPGTPAGRRRLPRQVELILPPGLARSRVRLRLVEQAGDRWERMFGLLERYVDTLGDAHVPGGYVLDGEPLCQWVTYQRQHRRRGLLAPARAERLEGLPGWRWADIDVADERAFQILAEHVARVGTARENPSRPSTFAGVYVGARPLGRWVARQRQAWRAGTINPDLAARLEALPGWQWQPLDGRDAAMVDGLQAFVAANGHANPPPRHVQDGLELGGWVAEVRRRKLVGTLPPALEDELLAATPPKEHTGARLLWDKQETQWRLGLEALGQFTAREGHAAVPSRHAEPLADTTVQLGQWCSLARYRHRRGLLPAERVAQLEALPGWQWTLTIRRAGPLDLADPATAVRAGAVDVIPARARLGKLVELGVSRQALARASGVPMLRVAGILDGRTSELPPEDAAAVLALTTSRIGELRALTATLAAVPPTRGWDEAWEQRFELLAHWAHGHGHARPRASVVVDGVPLGHWVSQQRNRYRRGKLPAERAERLEALPGWVWLTRAPHGHGARRSGGRSRSAPDRQPATRQEGPVGGRP